MRHGYRCVASSTPAPLRGTYRASSLREKQPLFYWRSPRRRSGHRPSSAPPPLLQARPRSASASTRRRTARAAVVARSPSTSSTGSARAAGFPARGCGGVSTRRAPPPPAHAVCLSLCAPSRAVPCRAVRMPRPCPPAPPFLARRHSTSPAPPRASLLNQSSSSPPVVGIVDVALCCTFVGMMIRRKMFFFPHVNRR